MAFDVKSLMGKLQRGFPKHLRGDRVMGLNRLMAGGLMLAALWLLNDDELLNDWLFPVVLWIACAVAILVHLILVQSFEHPRRSFGMFIDIAGTTIMLGAGGEKTAFLYAVYLWIIIGNGFRFGGGYMVAASVLSVASFAGVIFTVPSWISHPSLSYGLLTGLAVLPAYSFALIRQLAKARREAEQANQAKSIFLAGVSHELRTPLQAIIGTVELLKGTRLDERQTDLVATINTAADSQFSLVQDVLEISRFEAGHGRIEKVRFNLLDLLGKVITISSVAARHKGLKLSSYVTARTPIWLAGDERHLREVLLNLCDNAVKFTPRGSVTLAADGVIGEGGAVGLRMEVTDTGIGIASKNLGHIFGLFTQADTAIFNRFGGTGLGLALCKRQVSLMGGEIGVESSPGDGSTFWINLTFSLETDVDPPAFCARVATIPANVPWLDSLQKRFEELSKPSSRDVRIALVGESDYASINQNGEVAIQAVRDPIVGLPSRNNRGMFATSVSDYSTDHELRQAMQIAHSRSNSFNKVDTQQTLDPIVGSNLAGRRVLLADDSEINRSVVSRMLERAGLNVVLANDGEEALTVLTDGDLDIALLDVNMPVMDGVETAQFYNFSTPVDQQIPLIGLTADGSKEVQARCLQAGMRVCLVKPIRSIDLCDAIESVMSNVSVDSLTVANIDPEQKPILDGHTLNELKMLGGPGFVRQLTAHFKHDWLVSVAKIDAAFLINDVHSFRFEAHALSSTSANMGAIRLQTLCASWSMISETTFAREGNLLIANLREEWSRTCLEFDRYNDAQDPL